MAKHTTAEILAYIASNITTNGTKDITGAILKAVLDYMVDVQVTPIGIELPVIEENEAFPDAENLGELLTSITERTVPTWSSGAIFLEGMVVTHLGYFYKLKNDVDSGNTTAPASDTTNYELLMSGANIVALLEALTSTDMLDASKVYATLDSVASTVQAAINDLYSLASTAVQDTGNETVAGIKTFSSFPVSPSSAPTTDYQLANKKYVDDTVNTGAQTTPAALEIDWSANRHFAKTVNSSPTFTFANLVECKEIKLELNLTGEGLSVTWPAYCTVTGSIAEGYNIITLYCTESTASSERVYIRIEN